MPRRENLITQYRWRHTDGPLTVRAYGRYAKEGLIIHGLTVNNDYPRGSPPTCLLPPPPVLL
jgi:hypothetical protein